MILSEVDCTLNGLSFHYGALMPPRLQYAIQICSPNPVVSTLHLEQIQSLGTQMLAGLPHLQYDKKILFVIYIPTNINIFLAVGRVRAHLLVAIKIFMGLTVMDASILPTPTLT